MRIPTSSTATRTIAPCSESSGFTQPFQGMAKAWNRGEVEGKFDRIYSVGMFAAWMSLEAGVAGLKRLKWMVSMLEIRCLSTTISTSSPLVEDSKEHVGRNSYSTFFDKCYELLKAGKRWISCS